MLVVYTAFIGANYRLLEPTFKNTNCKMVCITTEDITSDNWEILKVKKPVGMTNVKFARYIKLHPHKYFPNDDVSLWIDSKFTVTSDVHDFVERYFAKHNVDMMIMDHNRRDCIYDEQETLNKNFADQPKVVADINRQIDAYKKEGMPEHFGLFSSGIMIRYHNKPNMIKFNELWWNEIKKYSQRDMISVPYILWKYPDLIKYYLVNFHKTYELFMNRT